MAKTQYDRIIFGLKVRQFRQEKGWNFEELSKKTGISVSYLNEIEKGKKYPQAENQQKLADALGITKRFLTSPELTKQYAPLGDLLQSNFLNELPLDLFGIDIQQIVEIIARAPDRVNAFISAILGIARNYSLREENFFFAALRAYQELHNNYFEHIENAADIFVKTHQIPEDGGVPSDLLASILEQKYNYHIDEKALAKHEELHDVRAVFNPKRRRLLLNNKLNERQRAFQLAKELGFNVLQLETRPLASNMARVGSFEEALNNYLAAYFAVAVLVNRHAFSRDVQAFFGQSTWDVAPLLAMMAKYQASPEVIFQRFNVLTATAGLDKVFFQRFIHHKYRNSFEIDKELHLNRKHQPHASGLNEHYCRRWLSIKLLQDLEENYDQFADNEQVIAGVQRAVFMDSGDEYLCIAIAIAKPGYPEASRNVSVTLGVLLDDQSKQAIRFWDDPAIPRTEVNITCQRCGLEKCRDRVAEPVFVQRREMRKKIQEIITTLVEK